jgi:hypothetical protein
MRPRGGIIGASVTPTQSAASGVWTMREAEAYARSGAWPAFAGPPTGVAGTAGNAQVSLTWTAPSATGGSTITDYTVQYSANSGSAWTTFSRSASTLTSATLTGLTNGTAYVFRVAAVTGYGTGAYSTASGSVTPVLSFTASAVLLTSGTSYTVPGGATSMKAWAVGQGGSITAAGGGAGGTAYKTWSVSGGQSVSYSVGAATGSSSGANTTVTFGGTTITGNGGYAGSQNPRPGGSFSGGDGGASGGTGYYDGNASWQMFGGAVGGNSSVSGCNRRAATDVSGLLAAVALAGGVTTETCATTPAFGSSGFTDGDSGEVKAAGLGGGGGVMSNGAPRPTGAVVLYFT